MTVQGHAAHMVVAAQQDVGWVSDRQFLMGLGGGSVSTCGPCTMAMPCNLVPKAAIYLWDAMQL